MKQAEKFELEGEKRELGRKSSEALRTELRVPSVLYGPKIKENLHFSISEPDLEKILSVSTTKLQVLSIDGNEYQTLLKNVEFDPVTDRALHADFYVLDEKTPVKIKIPVRLTGTAIGVRDGGGRVFQPLRIVRVKVLPERIPSQFELDISHLEIGDSIQVGELDLDGIELLDDPSRTIVTIAPPKSEELFTASTISEEDELEEAVEGEEEELEEGELAEGEEAEGEDEEETKE